MMEGNILLPLVSCSRRFDFSSLSFFPCFIHRCINTSASDFFLFTSHQMVIDILKSDIDLQARPGLRNSIISKDILVLILHFCNNIGIGVEIGTAKEPQPVLFLVLLSQISPSHYWYWYCYWKKHTVSIVIAIGIAKLHQGILLLLLILQNSILSIEVILI